MKIMRFLLFVMATALLISCNSQANDNDDANAEESEPTQQVSGLTPEQQTLLENGYAQMYSAVSGLGWTDKIFLIKFETERVEQFGTRLAEASQALKADLESMASANAWLDLENTGLPEIENRKISAVQKDRLKSFAPIIGRSQANFERTLLLSNSGALNQMQHLAGVMVGIEPDPQRKEFLQNTHQTFSDLYEADIELLNSEYFCDNTAEESKDFR